METQLLSPELQYGAFAICALLIVVLVWYIRYSTSMLNRQFRSLQQLQSETNNVLRGTQDTILKNTVVAEKLVERHDRDAPIMADIRDRLMERPCLRDRRSGRD